MAQLNDYDVMAVKVQDEFVWQSTTTQVTFFSCSRASWTSCAIAPSRSDRAKGVEHRRMAKEEVHLLEIEPTGTPNACDKRTAGPRKTAERYGCS
jgi:hypothetical protein